MERPGLVRLVQVAVEGPERLTGVQHDRDLAKFLVLLLGHCVPVAAVPVLAWPCGAVEAWDCEDPPPEVPVAVLLLPPHPVSNNDTASRTATIGGVRRDTDHS